MAVLVSFAGDGFLPVKAQARCFGSDSVLTVSSPVCPAEEGAPGVKGQGQVFILQINPAYPHPD